jgi:zinc-ribbon domain
MDCPYCSTPHPEAARFCSRCGTPLHAGISRAKHFAAQPDEPVRALAVMSTLMPHLTGVRQPVYRNAVGLALLAALFAAAFGMLSISLILAAVALPAVVLTYIHDHRVWRNEPITLVGVAFLLSLVLGVAVGLLEDHFKKDVLLIAPSGHLPSITQILEVGVLIPVVAYVAALIAPVVATARPAFRHPIDTVVACALSGAAFSLGLSIVVQRGAFMHIGASDGDPANVAFIALTLGFVQPIVFATAAAVTVLHLRRKGSNTASGIAQGLGLVLVYGLATTLLGPYGSRGIVLTALVAAVLAATGLVSVRDELHKALIADAYDALEDDVTLTRAPLADQVCAHCGAAINAGAAFCQACGSATAALPRHKAATTTPSA